MYVNPLWRESRNKMKISQKGLELIKSFEGLRLKAYKDGTNIYTIGFGTTKIDGKSVSPGLQISRERAEELLLTDIEVFVRFLNAWLKTHPATHINQNQFDSLVSYIYNRGPGNFIKSNIALFLSNNDTEKAASAFMDEKSVPNNPNIKNGIRNRRLKEQELFTLTD